MIAHYSSHIRPQLYYWHREAKSSNAEVDYVVQKNEKIIPIEVKAGTKGQMQSMRFFMRERGLTSGIRVSQENFGMFEDIKTVPIYAADINFIEESFTKIFYSEIRTFLTYYKSFFKGKIHHQPESPAPQVLKWIIEYIKENHLPPLYIIIDEYDNFTNQLITSHKDQLYYGLTTRGEEGDSFFRTFFKVIKAGVESRSVGRVFITGVLPITIDDLTSGFNITEIVTLEANLHDMLGFTQDEVNSYVKNIFEIYEFDKKLIPEIIKLLENYYNGYQFLIEADNMLYNSTILTYFLKRFVLNNGVIPKEMIDTNVRTDLSWIKRLIEKKEQTVQLVETLMIDGTLSYDSNELDEKFNMARFFEPGFYSISLFYLGMLTRQNDFIMTFPNQTIKQIFAGYYYDLMKISGVDKYVSYFEQFVKDGDLEKVFAGYWETYIAQIPAQAFDKMNENFFRISFFELCSRYLSNRFTFAIEANYPSGRSDWEMLGRRNSGFDNQRYLVEFKYFTGTETNRQKLLVMEEACRDELNQIKAYEKDILGQFPQYKIQKAVIYIAGNKEFRFFKA